MDRPMKGTRPTGLWLLALGLALATASVAPAAESFDDAPMARLLAAYVDGDGLVDYRGLAENRSELDRVVEGLGSVDAEAFAAWPEAERIAFWINAYNVLTLQSIVDHYPIRAALMTRSPHPNGIRQIPGVWNEAQHRVMGRELTLDQIEHEILRAEYVEPRIHVALVCAAMSCPPLRAEPFRAATLDAQLDDQARRFIAPPFRFTVDREDGEVKVSRIFMWYGKDFVGSYGEEADGLAYDDPTERAVLAYLLPFLAEEDARYVTESRPEVDYLPYDWSLNEQ